MKDRIRNDAPERKDAETMTVTLDTENTRNLQAAARVLNTDPERLLNEWLIRDQLRDCADPLTGYIGTLYEAMIWDDPAVARTVAMSVNDHLRKGNPRMRRVEMTKEEGR